MTDTHSRPHLLRLRDFPLWPTLAFLAALLLVAGSGLYVLSHPPDTEYTIEVPADD